GVFLAKNRDTHVTFYVIDRTIAFLLIILRPFFHFHLIFEYHAFYYNWLDRLILRKTDALIFLTRALQKKAHQWSPFAQKAIVLPEGIDLEPYERLSRIPADELRKKLNLPQDKVLIGYIGRFRPLDMDKGITTLVSAASEMPSSIHIYCIGGAKGELAFYQNMAKEKGVADRITLLSFVDPSLVPEYARAFDILTYIPPANDFFSYYTSPMKLFEYMAAEKPIVVSDLPAFREILNEQSAYFIPPADSQKFVSMIRHIIANRDEAEKRARYAREQVLQYTWDRRAEAVIKLCKTI
ncbi:MAG: glycosyltransferase family 4 protein, partial [bacterium]|nr:glycosyltransferase family 4 protein [bacterium]